MLGCGKEICGPEGSLGPCSPLVRSKGCTFLHFLWKIASMITEVWALAVSAAALRHTGPVRAAAREASFADAAEGTAGVHAPLALAQQSALVQFSALINVCKVA